MTYDQILTALFILAVSLIGGGLLSIFSAEYNDYRRQWK